MNNKLKLAIYLAFGTTFISGISNFVAKFSVKIVQDPVVFTFLKNIIVAVFLVGIILFARKWREIKNLKKNDWIKLIAIGIIGGSIPFILFFSGLAIIPAVTASFIHKTLFIWVAILAVPFLKERLGFWPITALFLLVVGNLVMFGLPKFTFGIGELMVLGATIFWAVENVIAKKALKNISSVTVSGARMLFGSVIIFAYVLFQGHEGMITNFSAVQWLWILIPSVLLIGYVLTWYTALKYAPAITVSSILVLATFITNLLQAVFVSGNISVEQLAGGALGVLGTMLIIGQSKKMLPKLSVSVLDHGMRSINS